MTSPIAEQLTERFFRYGGDQPERRRRNHPAQHAGAA